MSQPQSSKDELRARRHAEIDRLSDEELYSELLRFAEAQWTEGSLASHARKHRGDFAAALGYPPGPDELRQLTQWVLEGWEQAFSGYSAGRLSYAFTRRWNEAAILILISRDGRIRTVFPTDRLDMWMSRNWHYIEVTNRAAHARSQD